MTERLLTAPEVAGLVGLSPETVLRRWRAGQEGPEHVACELEPRPPAAYGARLRRLDL
jgi:hypothetical protein